MIALSRAASLRFELPSNLYRSAGRRVVPPPPPVSVLGDRKGESGEISEKTRGTHGTKPRTDTREKLNLDLAVTCWRHPPALGSEMRRWCNVGGLTQYTCRRTRPQVPAITGRDEQSRSFTWRRRVEADAAP